MLNSNMLLAAMSGAREEYLEQAQAVLRYDSSHRATGRKKLWRTLLIAAAVTALLTGAAYGASLLFKMNVIENHKTLSQDFNGSTAVYNDIGLVLSFEGPEQCHRMGFKASYLPSKLTYSNPHPDGEWYMGLSDDSADQPAVAYNIYSYGVSSRTSFIIGGKTEIVKEYTVDELQVMEVSADYSGTDFEHPGITKASFVILFDEKNGYILIISSNRYGLDELEKVMANMEVYIYQETYTPEHTLDYGFINPGRG